MLAFYKINLHIVSATFKKKLTGQHEELTQKKTLFILVMFTVFAFVFGRGIILTSLTKRPRDSGELRHGGLALVFLALTFLCL